LLEKLPVAVPSVVFELAVVGAAVVAQQMPLVVTVPPPLEVILPPETAVVKVIEVTPVVVSVGMIIAVVVKDSSLP
jgi:hypothetical protein